MNDHSCEVELLHQLRRLAHQRYEFLPEIGLRQTVNGKVPIDWNEVISTRYHLWSHGISKQAFREVARDQELLFSVVHFLSSLQEGLC